MNTYMYTGLYIISPFFAVLLVIILIDHAFSKISRHTLVHLFFALVWALYLYIVNSFSHGFVANIIASTFQIVFAFFYLELLHNLDHTIFTYILVAFLGGIFLAFAYNLIYILAGGQLL